LDKAQVAIANRFIPLEAPEILGAAHAALARDLGHDEGFRAECLGGAVLGVHIQPIDGRADQNDASHADDYA
jgi:hypothetical protein